ncbi:MAG: tellurium resistance protein TerC [Chloroflexota bacterium]
MDFSFIVIILQLIFLEGILSIDNAAVLGAMVSVLPSDQPIPWPKALTWLGKILDKPLGHQREGALRAGLLGAYIGRGLMLLAASYIIRNPWLKLVGAAYLIRLALDDLGAGHHEEADEDGLRKVKQTGFWITVLNVELMDLAFSLDNVVAAVSLSDQLWVVMLGVFIGILVMRFAAGIFSSVVLRFPVLKAAAYVLVLNIGVELVLEELGVMEFSDWARFGISVATILMALAYDRLHFVRVVLRPVLIWLSQGFGLINGLINWLLVPLGGLLGLLFRRSRRPQPSVDG